MNTLSKRLHLIILAAATILLTFCKEPDKNNDVAPAPSSVLVLNEGNFLQSNAEISELNKTTKTIRNSIFNSVNNRPLGDVLQSGVIVGDRLYLVLNNSNKIEVINANTYQSISTITGLSLPRYMAVRGNKGFVTEWVSFSGNGRVAVINLSTGAIEKTLPAGKFPEQILLSGEQLFVANSDDSTLTVIDAVNESINATWTVGISPNSLAEVNGKLWILCGGKVNYSTFPVIDTANSLFGQLIRANGVEYQVEQRLIFPDQTKSPSRLNSHQGQLYYTYNNAVFRLNATASSLPTDAFITRSGVDAAVPLYGLGIDPKDGTVYVAFSNFTSANRFNRYTLQGTFIDTYNSSAGPNGFLFK